MNRLGEQPEFATLSQIVATQLGVTRQMIDKDYWVTETLRELVRSHPGEFVFKGGTSLSKCFALIDRFSEDIDILLTDAFATRGERDRAMKAMQSTATSRLPLVGTLRRSERGVSRDVDLAWPRHGSDAGGTMTGIAPSIRLEMGMRGSHLPSLERPVSSLLVETLTQLDETAAQDFIPEHDRAPVLVPALHPGRTLVEKLLLLSGLAERIVAGDLTSLPARQGRHIYDVIRLLDSGIVRDFLEERETFLEAVTHAQSVSAEHWGITTSRPSGGFAESLLITGGNLVDDAFAEAYRSDVPPMLIGDSPAPPPDELKARIVGIAELL